MPANCLNNNHKKQPRKSMTTLDLSTNNHTRIRYRKVKSLHILYNNKNSGQTISIGGPHLTEVHISLDYEYVGEFTKFNFTKAPNLKSVTVIFENVGMRALADDIATQQCNVNPGVVTKTSLVDLFSDDD